MEDFGNSCGALSMILLDTRSGYYQVRVSKCKFTTLGHKIAHNFYTLMIETLRKEWIVLFAETSKYFHHHLSY